MYIRRKTFPKVRNDLFEMIRIIKELFIERLKKCDWMDETSKAKAIKKAKAIEHMVGADDFLYDVEKFDRILGFDNVNIDIFNILPTIIFHHDIKKFFLSVLLMKKKIMM